MPSRIASKLESSRAGEIISVCTRRTWPFNLPGIPCAALKSVFFLLSSSNRPGSCFLFLEAVVSCVKRWS